VPKVTTVTLVTTSLAGRNSSPHQRSDISSDIYRVSSINGAVISNQGKLETSGTRICLEYSRSIDYENELCSASGLMVN